jgi:predicted PurR-regulated permease PerM
VSGVLVILFLSLYWIVNQIHFERLWLSLLPSGQRKQARDIWRTIEPDLGAYIRSQLFHSLLAGLLLGLGYWALGSPYPTLLALAGALACLIPVVGVDLAVIPVLLIGLLTGVQLSLFTVLYTLIVLIALGVWVKPRLFNRRWDNPILTLVILIALANAFGLLGLVLAPPLSAVCQILWNLLVSHRLASGAAAQVSDLKERQERVRVNISAMDGRPLPLVTSSMERLTRLIEKAEPVLQAALPAAGLPAASLPAEPSEPFRLPQSVTADGGQPGPTKP